MNLEGHLPKRINLPAVYDDLTPIQRAAVRAEYIERQSGDCHYCGCKLTGPPRHDVAAKPVNRRLFPTSFFKWPVHLHHCHETGLTIGAVHAYCNSVLWQHEGE